MAWDRSPSIEQLQAVTHHCRPMRYDRLAKFLLELNGDRFGRPGAAAEIEAVAVRAIFESLGAQFICESKLFGRAELDEFLVLHCFACDAANLDLASRKKLRNCLIDEVVPCIRHYDFIQSKMNGRTYDA